MVRPDSDTAPVTSQCAMRIGVPAYAVGLATLSAVAALILARRPGWETAAFAWWAACAIALAFTDAAVHRLPNRLTYSAAAGTAALLGSAAVVERDGPTWIRAMVAGGGAAVLFAALTCALRRHGPGLGDAKLMLSIGMVLGWISWAALIFGVFVGMVVQGGVAVVLLVTGRAHWSTMLPLGPFLVGGAILSIAVLG